MARKKFVYFLLALILVLMVLGGVYVGMGFGAPHIAANATSTSQAASAGGADTTAVDAQVNPTVVANPTVQPPVGTVLESVKSGTPVTPDVISTTAAPPEGSIEYRNDKYGFSYYHSSAAKITEYDEGGGAMTLTHENFEKVRGFQVFIVPYKEALITEARFKQDVPSGVRKNVEDATLDGVRAVTFNSIDSTLGETREIWVIHNGYLYEITTFSGVGQWFTPIIQSWRFF